MGAGCRRPGVVFRQTNETICMCSSGCALATSNHEHVRQAAQGRMQATGYSNLHCSRWAGLCPAKGEQATLRAAWQATLRAA